MSEFDLEGIMFERFTDRARRVVVLAQEEARMLSHNYIGTEHILLGLIHEGDGVAFRALDGLGISLEGVRSQVEEIIGYGQQSPSGHIPFTPRGKKVMELSLREALQLGHNYIGTEHLLLGLIREGEGVAAQILAKLGAELKLVRHQVVELLACDRNEAAPPFDGSYVQRLLIQELGSLNGQIRNNEAQHAKLIAARAEVISHMKTEPKQPEEPKAEPPGEAPGEAVPDSA